MNSDIEPELIQPEFLQLNNPSLSNLLFFVTLIILLALVVYRIKQSYSILRLLNEIHAAGIKNTAYRLTSNVVYKRLLQSEQISLEELNVINGIKYQEETEISADDLKKYIKRAAFKALTGKLNAV